MDSSHYTHTIAVLCNKTTSETRLPLKQDYHCNTITSVDETTTPQFQIFLDSPVLHEWYQHRNYDHHLQLRQCALTCPISGIRSKDLHVSNKGLVVYIHVCLGIYNVYMYYNDFDKVLGTT